MRRRLLSLAALLCLIAVAAFPLAVHYHDAFAHRERPLAFAFSACSTVDTPAQLHHGYELMYAIEHRLPYQPAQAFQIRRSDGFVSYGLALPPFPLMWLRMDPLLGPGEVRLRDMRITDEQGSTVLSIAPSQVERLNPSASVSIEGDEVVVRRQAGRSNDYPALHFRIPYPIAPVPSPRSVRAVHIGLIVMAGVLTLVGLAGLLGRDFLRLRAVDPSLALRGALAITATALAVLGLKLAVIAVARAPFPYWDQWNGEGGLLYVPFWNGNLSWRDMFAGNNEHRIFFTRVQMLALLLLNGQWDVRLQTLVNALLHTVTGAGLVLWLWKRWGRRHLGALCLLFLLIFGTPFAWENTVWGFQVQFYHMVGFSLLAFWLLTSHPPFTPRWILGWGAAIAALFSLASGVLIVGAVAGVMLLRWWRAPRSWKSSLVTLIGCGLFLLYARPFLILHLDFGMKAHSFQRFLLSFSKALAWPWGESPWAAILFYAPSACLALAHIRRRTTEHPEGVETVVGLAGWIGIQALAAGYSRGAFGGPPEPRHQDIFALGSFVNAIALAELLARYPLAGDPTPHLSERKNATPLPPPPKRTPQRRTARPNGTRPAQGPSRLRSWLRTRHLVWLLASLWWLGTASGIAMLSVTAGEKGLPQRRDQVARSVATYRKFIRTDDLQEVLSKTFNDLPFPVAMQLPWMFRHEYLRRIMPSCAALPIPVTAQPGRTGPFRPHGYDPRMPTVPAEVWGSFSEGGPAAVGVWISHPLTNVTAPYLEFEVTGEAAADGMALELHRLDGREVVPVRPGPHSFPTRWYTVTVRRPRSPFVIVAQDLNPGRWFAFQEPRPTTRLSAWADHVIDHAGWLIGIAGVLGLGLAVLPRRNALRT